MDLNTIMGDNGFLDFVFYILVWISLAEFAIQVVISELSDFIKGAILLQQPYHSKLQTLSLIPFWRKLLGKWWIIATPFIFLVNIHKFFSQLFACPYCQGFHYAWIVNYFYLDFPLLESFLLAPLVLVFIAILDRLHIK